MRTDIFLVYKILFGIVHVNSNEFFIIRNQPHLRGHKYVLNEQRSFNTRRSDFFSNRIVNLWNKLPASTTDFTGLHPPSPPLDNIQVMVIVWRLRGNIIRTAPCWVV